MSQKNSGVAKVQHYVPQFLLKKFGNGKKDQLHVFDKHNKRIFPTNVKNIASESRFYDFNINGVDLTMESMLSAIEGKARSVIQDILEKDSLAQLSTDDKDLLSVFFAIQFTRTRWYRENYKNMFELLKQKQPNTDIKIPDENELKIASAKMMLEAVKGFSPHFLNKCWVFLSTTKKHPFIIGDHPVAMQNMVDTGFYGNIGLAVKGIEIYFPLSPTRALGLWCPSIQESVIQDAETLRQLKKLLPYRIEQQIHNSMRIEELENGMRNGTPILYSNENVINFNSLQIEHAERYVFSSNNDFSLAQKMLSDSPTYSRGTRMKIS
jgi:hypothetical protein